jgi:glycosyltransferase involved in cell wall biosynthesis
MLADEERSAIRIRVFGCDMPSQKIHGVNVEFLGKLSLEELIPQYRAADLFAFPSRQETWGQTKTEALCCGTPVIAFDQTACAEGIRHQENGWIAPANDIEAYAEGIRWFLQRWKDRKALIVQDEVTDYTPIIIGEQWKCFYQKILSKAS